MDNLFLISTPSPSEAITDASVGLSYARIDGSSSLNASGWLSARRFDRVSAYSGPQFGLSASSRLGPPRSRLRLVGSLSNGLNFASFGSARIGLPQTELQAGSASAGFTYRLTPDTSFDASLDGSGIRYRADILLDTTRLLGDSFVPPEELPGASPLGLEGFDVNPLLIGDAGSLALSLLAAEGVRTLRLDFANLHAGAGISHEFSPRTRVTMGGGYRRTYQNPHTFSEGDQSEAQLALREVLSTSANLSLSYSYQENRFGITVRTHAVTAQAEKQLGTKVRLIGSLGESYLDGPGDAASGWTLIGGAGLSARLKRTTFSTNYTRTRYQGLISGRSEITDVVYASLAHTISRRVSVSGLGYYRDSRSEVNRGYSYATTMLSASLGVRIKRRTTAGASYNFQRFQTRNTPSAERSVVSLYVGYARAFK
jgi:hypothetical protein